MRRATVYRIYNEAVEGSMRNIGCGLRTVFALPPGRKWITIIDWTNLDTATISIKDWERMKPQPVEYRAAVLLRSMKSYLPYKFEDGKPTQTIKQAMKIIKGAA